jgi:hypothetical protein
VYDGELLLFLHTDGDYRYCTCGGRLVEGVAAKVNRHYRLVVPGFLRDTSLHRQLEELLEDKDIEVAYGRGEDSHIRLFNCLD